MNRRLLFKATLREINFLIERNYLNERGLSWAKELLLVLKKDSISEDSE